MTLQFNRESLSARLKTVKPSPTIAITRLAAELRRNGKNIVALSQGEPDFDTPDHIKAAAKNAIDNGETKYTDVDGTPALKRAIVDKFKNENGLDYEVANISVGTGGKQVIFNAFSATLDQGDEVIIPAPYWVSYPDMVLLTGGVPVTVSCGEKSGFKLTAEALEGAITPRTKWLVLNSPSNPTGAGYSAAELKALAEVLLRHPRVLVMTDDMYEHIRYDGWEFYTITAVEPRLRERVLTCNGVSKAYAMTGWRIGWIEAPEAFGQVIENLIQYSTSGSPVFVQRGAVAALDEGEGFVAEQIARAAEGRRIIFEGLKATNRVTLSAPVGAFYQFFSIDGRDDSRKLALELVDKANVGLTPGTAFGPGGETGLRLCFARKSSDLVEAVARLQKALAIL